MTLRRLLTPLAVMFVVAVAASSAHAQSGLAAADRAYDAGNLGEAGRAYEDALSAGGLSRAEVARAHLHLAVLAALGEERSRFERHAATALALDPELPAPVLHEGYAARFSELVGEARRLRLALSAAGDSLSVEVHGPPGLVQTITLRGPDGWARTLPWRGEPLTVMPPPTARPLSVEGLDAHGNVLVRAGRPAVQESAPPGPEAASAEPAPAEPVSLVAVELEPDSNETPLVESPWLWIGVGLLAVGIGVVVGLTAFGERYVLDAPVVR